MKFFILAVLAITSSAHAQSVSVSRIGKNTVTVKVSVKSDANATPVLSAPVQQYSMSTRPSGTEDLPVFDPHCQIAATLPVGQAQVEVTVNDDSGKELSHLISAWKPLELYFYTEVHSPAECSGLSKSFKIRAATQFYNEWLSGFFNAQGGEGTALNLVLTAALPEVEVQSDGGSGYTLKMKRTDALNRLRVEGTSTAYYYGCGDGSRRCRDGMDASEKETTRLEFIDIRR